MRIAIISRSDASAGGASRIAENLAVCLKEAGVEVDHWVPEAHRLNHNGLHSLTGGSARSLFWKLCSTGTRILGYPDTYTPEFLWIADNQWLGSYDLIHLHDTSRAISPFGVARLAEKTPVVWTLHDCSAFTGGCLYPSGCEYFKTECHDCYQLDQWPQRTKFDRTGPLQRSKRALLSSENIYPVAPSHWMANQADEAHVFSRETRVVPNGVDTNIYRPHSNIKELRRRRGIPEDAFVVLLSANSLDTPRKGTARAINLLEQWQHPFHLVLIGSSSEQLAHRLKNLPHTFTGYIDSKDEISECYSLGDVLLFTSTADNLPNVILESMACGTPVVGNSVGGVVDMVEHDKNGWLAAPDNDQELLAGLDRAHQNSMVLAAWGKEARGRTLNSFSEQLSTERYVSLYGKTIS